MTDQSQNAMPSILHDTTTSGWRLALVLYGVLGAILCVVQRDLVDIDGIAYASLADYIAAGRFHLGLSGIWSPMLAWLTAIPVAFGLDTLLSLHFVFYLVGFVGLLGCRRIVRAADLPPVVSGIALVGSALVILRWSAWNTTPDAILASFLLLYGAETLQHDFPTAPRRALRAGLFGGLAILAKSYALPFLLVHAALTLLWIHPGAASAWRPRVRAWLLCAGGAALVFAPYALALSLRVGEPTTGYAGSFALRVTLGTRLHGPLPHDMSRQLTPPTPPDISPHIDSGIEHCRVSSVRIRARDLPVLVRHTLDTGQDIVAVLRAWDPLGLHLLLPLLALALGCVLPTGERRSLYRWIVMTVGVYLGGFLPLLFFERYAAAFVQPLLLIAGLRMLADLFTHLRTPPAPRMALAFHALLALTLVGLTVAYTVYLPLRYDMGDYRRIARALEAVDIPAPLATSQYGPGLVVAYHMQVVTLGEPYGTPKPLPDALAHYGVQTFLAWNGSVDAWQARLGADWHPVHVLDDLRLPGLSRVHAFVHVPHDTLYAPSTLNPHDAEYEPREPDIYSDEAALEKDGSTQ